MATAAQFAYTFLEAAGWPTSTANLQIIVGWCVAEGGGGVGLVGSTNAANYNPLNTTEPGYGGVDIGNSSVGVKAYPSWSEGIQATVAVINNGYYPSIIAMLKAGNVDADTAASTIDGSVWGTATLTSSLITGADISGAGPIPGVSGLTNTGGGILGAGGTGTSANVQPTTLWTVGDSSNPDEDYFSCISQYGMDAQWYVFSDGETFYVADGIQLMAQTPAAIINRVDPSVMLATMTYDNTSFQYVTTHMAQTTPVRRAALAKTTSPTQIQIQIICDIDQYRSGDTVYLQMFGPADGPWLVGQTRRSVFQPYTTLTLVQAMQPINALSGLPFNVSSSGTAEVSGSFSSVGGYVNPLQKATGIVSERVDQGVDYSMDPGSPILAIGNCTLVGGSPANLADWFDNEPELVFQFADGQYAGQYYYLAEQIDPVTTTIGTKFNAGDVVAHYAASGTGIETGWAQDAAGTTRSFALEGIDAHGPFPSQAGLSFNTFLVSLHCPSGDTSD